ncbi:MAG TPA: DUF4314 domain-containing protein [Pirellulaceae bacterium]|nr:DUF4314 domain-containing protein [Pirellulaceae bacterium]
MSRASANAKYRPTAKCLLFRDLEFDGPFEEAAAFCLHPENRRLAIKVPSPGDRIRLVRMSGDPHPIEAGRRGTVIEVERHGVGADVWHQIQVAWDNGRTLMLTSPPDEFEIVPAGRR